MAILGSGKPVPQIDVRTAHRLWETRRDVVVILDIRNPDEWFGETGHIDGAILIPIDGLPINLEKLREHKDKEVLVIGHISTRSAMATQFLKENGFRRVYSVEGGMRGWVEAELPTVHANSWPEGPDKT
jgi:hydroxyacylglutathione hydrolase